MSGTHGWLDMLKVKASIGSQGNDKIGDYRYVDTYRLASSNGEMSVAFLEKGNPQHHLGDQYQLQRRYRIRRAPEPHIG